MTNTPWRLETWSCHWRTQINCSLRGPWHKSARHALHTAHTAQMYQRYTQVAFSARQVSAMYVTACANTPTPTCVCDALGPIELATLVLSALAIYDGLRCPLRLVVQAYAPGAERNTPTHPPTHPPTQEHVRRISTDPETNIKNNRICD